nr:hypothetical protein BaRGS_018374 [Batillaria attramentaria]
MDTDSNDGTSPETLNGETKPDPAKLAQTAIIKQDVMLSATSTQSPLAPVSSVFTMPSVSLPHASIAGAGALGLADQLFMSVPSVADTATTPSAADAKSDLNGVLPTLTSQTQLLGQPQVASQFFLANQQAMTGTGSTTPSLPVQQILIPVSTGNGAQQFISIPVSLATGGNQQIQLLSTSNGQIIATNLASLQALAQPLNLDTVGNCTESTTVDGINLDEIKEFARQFKIRRLSLGLTQTQVGQALSATEGPAYSQSAICRFEKLDITPKSAQKIKPVLERWMSEAEERYKNGTEMTELSERLNYDREVIRVWFCNKRQALKNTIKKLKQEAP